VNLKAVFLGLIAGIAAAFLGGVVLGFVAGASGFTNVERWLQDNIWLVYAMNAFAGFVLGVVVARVARVKRKLNVMVAATALVVLSLVSNPDLIQAILDPYDVEQLLSQGLLPLLVGWIVPFIVIGYVGDHAPDDGDISTNGSPIS
jgi:hypothetical protein